MQRFKYSCAQLVFIIIIYLFTMKYYLQHIIIEHYITGSG